ncbi:MAG: hypothetical protein DWQ05_16995 [Calditrichaeota bacterium]|nr:MAG: hypothetical protein DWQ05_16995 [Calditrichota bacterium]
MKVFKIMHLFLLILVLGGSCSKSADDSTAETAAENKQETMQPQVKDSASIAVDRIVEEPQQIVQKNATAIGNDAALKFDPDGQYTLQLSSWKTRKYAERDKQRFFDAGLDCQIAEEILPESGEKWYRLRIGSFRTRKAARAFADKYIGDLLEEPPWIDYK